MLNNSNVLYMEDHKKTPNVSLPQLLNIKLDSIVTNNQNPRKHFNKIDELAQNISEVGLLQPITVHKFGDKLYRITMGHRRYLACKSLGWQEIPCIIIESTPEDDDWYMLSENLQRDDLSEVEKAEKLHEMIFCGDHKLYTLEKAAKKLGLNFSYLAQLLKLHGYPTEIKEEIKSGNIGADTIRSINKLETPEEQIKVVQYATDNELNRKQVDETIAVVKELPQPIRQKLTEEPEYTIGQAKDEYIESFADVTLETPDEFYDGATDYKTIQPMVVQCKNALKEDYIKQLRPIEKVKLKGDLQVLKAQIEAILSVIDWI